ncbi:unnamed protein product [Schistosoma curassoni]|uniref:Uncharacterized protein n=1 Tax=Schistosoma curassoni TaxID=6186 RepID=A0A183JCN8_9TREM|nr:unnamed protein product [Schistosoma curassoni]
MVAGDQQLVHTPFVPSGYWGPCAPLVCNQSFATPLGGLSVSTNPVKALDIRFSRSQVRIQHSWCEEAALILFGGYLYLTFDKERHFDAYLLSSLCYMYNS